MKTKHFLLMIFLFLMGSQVISSQSEKSHLPVIDISKSYPKKEMGMPLPIRWYQLSRSLRIS